MFIHIVSTQKYIDISQAHQANKNYEYSPNGILFYTIQRNKSVFVKGSLWNY